MKKKYQENPKTAQARGGSMFILKLGSVFDHINELTIKGRTYLFITEYNCYVFLKDVVLGPGIYCAAYYVI